MNTIPAQVIKQRGISAVDEHLERGPVHVITRNEPRYVVMSQAQYEEWRDSLHEAYLARVRMSLADVAAGRVHTFNSHEELMAAIDAVDEDNEDEEL